jgi:hypothetical protein
MDETEARGRMYGSRDWETWGIGLGDAIVPSVVFQWDLEWSFLLPGLFLLFSVLQFSCCNVCLEVFCLVL